MCRRCKVRGIESSRDREPPLVAWEDLPLSSSESRVLPSSTQSLAYLLTTRQSPFFFIVFYLCQFLCTARRIAWRKLGQPLCSTSHPSLPHLPLQRSAPCPPFSAPTAFTRDTTHLGILVMPALPGSQSDPALPKGGDICRGSFF